jgi:hypothetical protein
MRVWLLGLLVSAVVAVGARADETSISKDEKPTPPAAPEYTYGGSADFYFSTNFNNPFHGRSDLRLGLQGRARAAPGPDRSLVQRRRDPVGFRLDVDFGPTARRFNAMEPSSSDLWEHLQQEVGGPETETSQAGVLPLHLEAQRLEEPQGQREVRPGRDERVKGGRLGFHGVTGLAPGEAPSE